MSDAKSEANAWARAQDEFIQAEAALRTARGRIDSAKAGLERAEKALLERVGNNIRERIYDVGTGYLLVEHERGVRFIKSDQ